MEEVQSRFRSFYAMCENTASNLEDILPKTGFLFLHAKQKTESTVVDIFIKFENKKSTNQVEDMFGDIPLAIKGVTASYYDDVFKEKPYDRELILDIGGQDQHSEPNDNGYTTDEYIQDVKIYRRLDKKRQLLVEQQERISKRMKMFHHPL